MSKLFPDPAQPGSSGGEDSLQFDRAEFSGEGEPEFRCTSCSTQLTDTYYRVNGNPVCPTCNSVSQIAIEPESSGMGRFLRALLYGTGAAAAGTLLYYGIFWVSGGWEFGLVAIIVGIMVGKAVFVGSGSRGGWKYQALAMFLTYASIVTSYVPSIIEELQKPENQVAAETAESAQAQSAGTGEIVEGEAIPAPAVTQSPDEEPLTTTGVAFGLLAILALSFALPFLAGFENILGLIIIGIGLYEAWKLNKRQETITDGPYQVGAAPPPTPSGA